MDSQQVDRWIRAHHDAWTSGDAARLDELFTPDVVLRPVPWADPLLGLDAVRAYWPEDVGLVLDTASEIVALDPPTAVVRLHVDHVAPSDAPASFRRLWVLGFAPDGRVQHFEDWPFRI